MNTKKLIAIFTKQLLEEYEHSFLIVPKTDCIVIDLPLGNYLSEETYKIIISAGDKSSLRAEVYSSDSIEELKRLREFLNEHIEFKFDYTDSDLFMEWSTIVEGIEEETVSKLLLNNFSYMMFVLRHLPIFFKVVQETPDNEAAQVKLDEALERLNDSLKDEIINHVIDEEFDNDPDFLVDFDY